MAVTDAAVEKAREKVEDLREQIAAERAKIEGTTADSANAVQKAQLEAEEARLKVELANLRDLAKMQTTVVEQQVEQAADPNAGAITHEESVAAEAAILAVDDDNDKGKE